MEGQGIYYLKKVDINIMDNLKTINFMKMEN